MSLNDPMQSLFLKGNAHDLRLRTNYPQSIESYSKISGLANLALGKSYKVLDGSNVYYVNREDLIKALGIVGPNVTDAMIEIELKWQRMLPTILEYLDVSNAQQLIEIPGAKEYLRGLTGGTPDSGLKPFVQNFVQKLTQLLPPEREKLFKLLLKMHFKAENIPEDAIITPLYPFINEVMGLPDANKKISLIWLFLDGVGNREAHDEALSSALIEFNRLLNEKLNEVFENPYMSPNARSVWSDIFISNEGLQKITNNLLVRNPHLLCTAIDLFPLSEEQLNAIAWKLAETVPSDLCWEIEKFALNKEQLNAIALQFAQTVPSDFCYCIKNFPLSDEQKRELALQFAQTEPKALCANIGKFPLSDEQKRELALQFAEAVPDALCLNIKKFPLSDEQKNALALKFVQTAPEALYRTRKEFNLNQEQCYVLTLKLIKIGNFYLEDILPQLSFDVKDKFECIIYSLILKINEDSLFLSIQILLFFLRKRTSKNAFNTLNGKDKNVLSAWNPKNIIFSKVIIHTR